MADRKKQYEQGKKKLLNDSDICKENIALFKKFFEYQEYKSKRVNNLREIDNASYKTLYGYILKFRNVNKWFNNKPIKDLTKEDIKKVYDALEDGKIKRKDGKPYENLEDSYYSKVFKSKPFEMAGKLELAKEVIAYTRRRNQEVRFILEDDFRKLVSQAYKPTHRLLLWLAFDIGENINSLLKLKKSDCFKQTNPHTKESEYRINLRKETLKRSRKPRSEITNYNETVQMLDLHLSELKDNDLLFNFEYSTAKDIIYRAVERAKVKCLPNGEKVTWKDLRSGMACDLLKKGWTTDEVNARLGHKPSSSEIDKYVNFLAIDRHRPKKKVQEFEMGKLQEELEELKRKDKLQAIRNESLNTELKQMQQQMAQMIASLHSLEELKAEKERRKRR